MVGLRNVGPPSVAHIQLCAKHDTANISPALGQGLVFVGAASAASACTMETAGQTGQTAADRGKPTCPYFCVQRGRHN